eukprot:1454797-Pyramimonas_sp.AAC.1
MDLDDADEDIDKLGKAQASVAAAMSAATSATGDDKAKTEQELTRAKRLLAEQIAAMAKRRKRG